MTSTQIKKIQLRIGTVPDGFWGPKSIAACQRHLRGLMPKPSPWPATNQRALTAFYGAPGDETSLTSLAVGHLGLRFEGAKVRLLRVHHRCATSLLRILETIAAGPQAAILSQFAGVYANRPMRGGSLPSLHARGAAIDLAPATNGLHTSWPTKATMPLEVMEAFAAQGWLPAGAFWHRDAMHFQATA